MMGSRIVLTRYVSTFLLTQQGVDKIPHVWLNGEFRTQLFTQVESEATQSPPDLVENDVSDPEPVSTDSDEEET